MCEYEERPVILQLHGILMFSWWASVTLDIVHQLRFTLPRSLCNTVKGVLPWTIFYFTETSSPPKCKYNSMLGIVLTEFPIPFRIISGSSNFCSTLLIFSIDTTSRSESPADDKTFYPRLRAVSSSTHFVSFRDIPSATTALLNTIYHKAFFGVSMGSSPDRVLIFFRSFLLCVITEKSMGDVFKHLLFCLERYWRMIILLHLIRTFHLALGPSHDPVILWKLPL